MPKRRVVRHEVTQPLDQSYRFIPLTQGQNSIVDAGDFDFLSQWNWLAHWSEKAHTFYAERAQGGHIFRMHVVILQCHKREIPDHIDHNGLNNRRNNLRISTSTQNGYNRGRINKNNVTGHKGVSFWRARSKWRARISANGRAIFLGYFDSPEAAAIAYDSAAKIHHGEFYNLPGPSHVVRSGKKIS